MRLEDMRIIAERSRQMMQSADAGGNCDSGAGMGLQFSSEQMTDGFWARLIAPIVSEDEPFYTFLDVFDDSSGDNWISTATSIPVPAAPTDLTGAAGGGGRLAGTHRGMGV